MPSLRVQLKERLRPLLSQPEWDALDARLKDNLVKKAVQEKKFTRLPAEELLAKLRDKLARADAGGANTRPSPPAAPGGRPSPLAPLHDVMAQCHKRQRLDEHTAARSRASRAHAEQLQLVRDQLAEASHVVRGGFANQRYMIAQLTHRAGLVLEATEDAHAAVHAGTERHREAAELVAKVTDLHGRVARGDVQTGEMQQLCAQLLARSRASLASAESGVAHLDAANAGRAAASQHLDELRSFNDWMQSALRAADAPPRPAALPQLPPLPPVQLFEAMRRTAATHAYYADVTVPKAAARLVRLRSGWRAWVAAAGGLARVGDEWLDAPLRLEWHRLRVCWRAWVETARGLARVGVGIRWPAPLATPLASSRHRDAFLDAMLAASAAATKADAEMRDRVAMEVDDKMDNGVRMNPLLREVFSFLGNS